jgi:hypothetical protein
VREFLFVETQFFQYISHSIFQSYNFFICFPVCLKISLFYFYICEGWLKKKKHLFFYYISIVILYVFFNLYFRCLCSSIFVFVPYIFIFFLLSLSIYINQFRKKRQERDSIRCFSMKNYTIVIFFYIFFLITVLFNFLIFISQ